MNPFWLLPEGPSMLGDSNASVFCCPARPNDETALLNLWSRRRFELVVVAPVRDALLIVVARHVRHVRCGQLRQHLPGKVRERERRARGIQLAGERMDDRNRQHSLALGQRGDRREDERPLHLSEALVVGEEERPVALDGTAGDEAELMTAQRRLAAPGRLEEPDSVHRSVPEELPAAAAKLVGATAIRRIHDGAAAPAVLGAVVVRLDLELGDGVRRNLDHLIGEALVARAVRVVVDTVELKVVRRIAEQYDRSVTRNGRTPWVISTMCFAARTP